MNRQALIKWGIALAGVVLLVVFGRSYFGGEQFAVVCGLVLVALIFGAYLGATKSKSVTHRVDRDNE